MTLRPNPPHCFVCDEPTHGPSLCGAHWPDVATRLDALTDTALADRDPRVFPATDGLLVGAMVAALAATEKALRR